ncbi:hypothetical protein [Hazenella coriacea]|uniref:Uncharacterized protein n=1 Tax=Hazenella coriacea TaxID=1179467 RepID=A0A4R3L1F9_9BACL|nr:hypothetical protein [Hazenella coriacea]TCS93393.1 hypothetical protein EDD58_10739 [Hazenella coriacea]
MDQYLSMEEVMSQIQNLKEQGHPLNKKKVKQTKPQLLQSALYYFPSWDHALKNSLNIKE